MGRQIILHNEELFAASRPQLVTLRGDLRCGLLRETKWWLLSVRGVTTATETITTGHIGKLVHITH